MEFEQLIKARKSIRGYRNQPVPRALIEEIIFRYTDRVELVIGIIFVLVIMYAPLGFSGLMLKLKFKWLMFKNKRMRQAA